jgi:hypothetical protein
MFARSGTREQRPSVMMKPFLGEAVELYRPGPLNRREEMTERSRDDEEKVGGGGSRVRR